MSARLPSTAGVALMLLSAVLALRAAPPGLPARREGGASPVSARNDALVAAAGREGLERMRQAKELAAAGRLPQAREVLVRGAEMLLARAARHAAPSLEELAYRCLDQAQALNDDGVAGRHAARGAPPRYTPCAPRTAMSEPLASPSLSALIDTALGMTEERIAATPGAETTHAMLASIRRQLIFMRDTVAAGRIPTTDEKNSLSLGTIAVRELETTDPPYCDAICAAAYRFGKL